MKLNGMKWFYFRIMERFHYIHISKKIAIYQSILNKKIAIK